MVRLYLLVLAISISFSSLAALTVDGAFEVDAPMTSPGRSSTVIVPIINSSSTESVVNMSPTLSGADYQYLGGSYPGVGGDCSTTLAAGANCKVVLEFSPTSAGDSDADLIFSYDIGALTAQSYTARIDGHSLVIGSGASCSGMVPSVSHIDSNLAEINSVSNIILTGQNFTPLTNISVPGLSVSNIQFHSAQKISFDLSTGASAKKYDLIVSSECQSVSLSEAIEVKTTLWIDLRVAANVTALNPSFDSSRITGYTVDPSFGVRLSVVGNNWRKGFRFDNHCGSVNRNFDIVVYRSAQVQRAVFGLFSDSTTINPSAGSNYHQRIYMGIWNYGNRANRAYGSQRYESGGVSWNQTFSAFDTLAGQYLRYHFKHAGQNGYDVEVWEVDSSFNDIRLVRSFTSSKTATPASTVCSGVVPYTAGDADFYLTGVRIK